MTISNLSIELNENTLIGLVVAYLNELMGNREIKTEDVTIEVKSKQNFKSEWEKASFRARVSKKL